MNKQTTTVAGITYTHPTVFLLQESGLGTSEVAARTAYDSFDKSENPVVSVMGEDMNSNKQHLEFDTEYKELLHGIESSDLLTSLAWVHHHHSVIEHCNLTYLIKGTSRGALQEEARHRIQSITVRSTRYTMQNLLHAFNSCSVSSIGQAKYEFTKLIKQLNMFVVCGVAETIEIHSIYDRLHLQLITLGNDEFGTLSMSKDAQAIYSSRTDYETPPELYAALVECKAKRNVGDSFKWVVTDNWKVDMVVTFNLRSLRNFFELRDSGAAYFQIRHLAQAMKSVTPPKYLDLIVKSK